MARITHVLSVLCLLPTVSLCLQNFSFPDEPTPIYPSKAIIKELDGNDTLALDGSNKSSARAFYNQSMEFNQSFASFFTISSTMDSSWWNGALAFVLVPSFNDNNLTKARETLSIEFNTSACEEGASTGGLGRIQVSAYANSSSLAESWLYPSEEFHNFNCPLPNYSTYEILVAYNATTNTVFVATPASSYPPYENNYYYYYMNFTLKLSSINSANPLYVGFIVSSGAYYNLSQWNFTAIDSSTGYLTTIFQQQRSSDYIPYYQISSPGFNPTSPGGGSDSGGSSSGSYKLSTGYVVTFSVLGTAIVVALVIGVWLLCRRPPAPRRSAAAAPRPLHRNLPQNAVFFDAAKFQPRPPPPSAQNHNNTPNLASERDTAPLNPPSAFQVSTTASSWLKPVTAR